MASNRPRKARRIVALKVACKLCDGETRVRRKIEGWLIGKVPAVVRAAPSKAKVRDGIGRPLGNVPVELAFPGANEIGERQKLKTLPLVVRGKGAQHALGFPAFDELKRGAPAEQGYGQGKEPLERFGSIDNQAKVR